MYIILTFPQVRHAHLCPVPLWLASGPQNHAGAGLKSTSSPQVPECQENSPKLKGQWLLPRVVNTSMSLGKRTVHTSMFPDKSTVPTSMSPAKSIPHLHISCQDYSTHLHAGFLIPGNIVISLRWPNTLNVTGEVHMGKGDFVVSVLSTPRRLLTVRARASVYLLVFVITWQCSEMEVVGKGELCSSI